jgi:hypothetical protein
MLWALSEKWYGPQNECMLERGLSSLTKKGLLNLVSYNLTFSYRPLLRFMPRPVGGTEGEIGYTIRG